MIAPPPWADARIVNAAIDLTCDVRDLGLESLHDAIIRIPRDDLAALAMTLAAMVDVDQPMTALRAWDGPHFAGERDRQYVTCQSGHLLTPANTYRRADRLLGCRGCATKEDGA